MARDFLYLVCLIGGVITSKNTQTSFTQLLVSNVERYARTHFPALEPNYYMPSEDVPVQNTDTIKSDIVILDKPRIYRMMSQKSLDERAVDMLLDKPRIYRMMSQSLLDGRLELTNELSGLNKSSIIELFGKRKRNSYKAETGIKINRLLKFISSLTISVPENEENFFEKWEAAIDLFPSTENYKSYFNNSPCSQLYINSVDKIAVSPSHDLFWPFIPEIAIKNQKLSLWGLKGEIITTSKTKTKLFELLEKRQHIRIPVDENKIVYSFNDPVLVQGLNNSGLLINSAEFVNKGLHLFNETEAEEIIAKVEAALDLIKENIPKLYRSIHKLVACFAFYKAESKRHLAGTISSALGVIWLDPSTSADWSIDMYAEQIVHEYIHTSLFYADMVHGMFSDPSKLSEAKVVSSIRRELRDYDKSLHAAYVSTGLVILHSKNGCFERAIELAKPLQSSVHDLVTVDKETNILDVSGKAVLQSMVDFLTLYGLYC